MSEQRSFREEISQLIRARFPLLFIESHEERRVFGELQAVAEDASLVRTTRPVYRWSLTDGLVDGAGNAIAGTLEPARALEAVLQHEESAVFVFVDLHASLGDERRPADPLTVRRLRDIAGAFQRGMTARTLVIVAPQLQLPPDLSKDVTIVDFPLPGPHEIRAALESIIEANAHSGRIQVELDEHGRERLVDAARGLTLQEAENAFARAIVEDGKLTLEDVATVTAEKQQTIRKSGTLEYVTAQIDLDDIGGLQNLKRWLARRNNSWMAEAAAYGLPSPKGVLITGVPGCGKSLTAKAVASAWQLPLLRFDIGRVFSGLVGSSEQNMRNALHTAEAVAPCVLWIDEIEKGFSGVAGTADSGTSARVFGSFLNWMQEKKSSVFVIATANNIDALPPELLRKGRFDEIFFVDLPTLQEREDIWSLHLNGRLKNPNVMHNLNIVEASTRLAKASEGYSGAEIEQAIVIAMFDSFSEHRALTEADLTYAIETMVSLSVTGAQQIEQVRSWADARAVAATAREDRIGYVSVQHHGAQQSSPPADDARGGRVVDF